MSDLPDAADETAVPAPRAPDEAEAEVEKPAEPTLTPAQIEEERRTMPARIAFGIALGFVAVALFNALAFAAGVPLGHGGVGLRVVAVLAYFGETLGIGAIAVGMVYACARWIPYPATIGGVIATGLGVLVMRPVAGVEIYRQACVAFDNPTLREIAGWFFLAVDGCVFPAAILVGVAFSRTVWVWIAPLVICLAAAIVNQVFMPDDYHSVHGVVSFSIALLGGATASERVFPLLSRPMGRRAAYALAALAAVGLATPLPNAVRAELYRDNTTFAPWLLAATIWTAPQPRAGTPAPTSPWFEKRDGKPDVPPSEDRIAPKDAVVVMVTIDATRADAVLDPSNDDDFKTLADLKRSGTTFTRATSPGSQTAVCLSTTFSGRMFSELHWEYTGPGNMRFAYPASDPTRRFPELLSEAGVATSLVSSVNFVDNGFGVVRGFQQQKMIARGRGHAMSRQMIPPVLDQLRRHGDGPLFLYFHLMEPHAPYDQGKRTGTDYERYLSEIEKADSELKRVVVLLDQKFRDRAVLIVGADHGEAFGEHGTTAHSKTLYDELVHVPLIVRTPKREHRVIDQQVLLADLGPTILDIFDVKTPATFIGQSLVPLIAGKKVTLDRPILAEGRLRRALTTPEGMKVIDDPRRGVVEAYDLKHDPEELVNLWGKDPRADAALLELRTFYANNEFRAPGYSPPYKP